MLPFLNAGMDAEDTPRERKGKKRKKITIFLLKGRFVCYILAKGRSFFDSPTCV